LQNWNFHFYRIEILLTIGVPVSKRYSMSEIKLDQSIKEMQEELKKARERLMSLLDEERKIVDNGAQNTQQGIKLINTTIPEATSAVKRKADRIKLLIATMQVESQEIGSIDPKSIRALPTNDLWQPLGSPIMKDEVLLEYCDRVEQLMNANKFSSIEIARFQLSKFHNAHLSSAYSKWYHAQSTTPMWKDAKAWLEMHLPKDERAENRLKDLYSLKCREGEDVIAFNNLFKRYARLAEISDNSLLCRLYKQAYGKGKLREAITAFITANKSAGYQLEDLIRHAVQANLELQVDEENITTTRIASKRQHHTSTKTDYSEKKKFTGNCNKCGKVGHKAVDCYSKVDNRSNQRFHPYAKNGSNSSSGSVNSSSGNANSSSGENSSSRGYFSNQQPKPQYASASSNNFRSSSSASTVSPATSYSSSSQQEGGKKFYHIRH
jgi:hypothetical protein